MRIRELSWSLRTCPILFQVLGFDSLRAWTHMSLHHAFVLGNVCLDWRPRPGRSSQPEAFLLSKGTRVSCHRHTRRIVRPFWVLLSLERLRDLAPEVVAPGSAALEVRRPPLLSLLGMSSRPQTQSLLPSRWRNQKHCRLDCLQMSTMMESRLLPVCDWLW